MGAVHLIFTVGKVDRTTLRTPLEACFLSPFTAPPSETGQGLPRSSTGRHELLDIGGNLEVALVVIQRQTVSTEKDQGDRLTKISRGEFEDFQKYKKVTLKQVCDLLRADYSRQERRRVSKAERSLKRLEKYFGEQ